MKQSRYLCSKIPNNEWVGALIYEFTGNWEDETLSINVLDIFPMHEADGMHFNSDYNFDYNYAIDKGYDIEKIRLGLIHSHCQSSVFFSNPDMDELKGTSKIHPFYLSLITNNQNQWTGKVCVYSEKTFTNTGTYTTQDVWGKKVKKEFSEIKKEDAYNIFDVQIKIVVESIEDDLFTNRVEQIIKDKKERDAKKVHSYNYHYNQNPVGFTNYQKPNNKITLEKDDLDFAILSFFEDGEEVDYNFVFNFAEYGMEYSPENFVRYIRKYYKVNSTNIELIRSAAKLISGFNSKFTKELVKDYKEYLKNYSKY